MLKSLALVIKSIKLNNFKNFEEINFDFNKDTTLIIGSNGRGKSNLLEAIDLLSIGKSYRTQSELDLVNHSSNKEFSRIEGIINKEDKGYDEVLIHFVEKQSNTLKKELRINKKKVNRAKFIGYFLSLLFDHNTLDLINSTPSIRRNYFDKILSSLYPEYFLSLMRYKKIIKNKSNLLTQIKKGFANISELEFWNASLCKEAEIIVNIRKDFIEDLNKELLSKSKAQKNKYNFEINYKLNSINNNYDSDTSLEDLLEINIERELALEQCVIGPHRDKFEFNLNSNNAKHKASRGEQRMFSLNVLIAISELINNIKGMPCVLLLDDILSELDETNSKEALKLIKKSPCQKIISSTNVEEFSGSFVKSATVIRLD